MFQFPRQENLGQHGQIRCFRQDMLKAAASVPSPANIHMICRQCQFLVTGGKIIRIAQFPDARDAVALPRQREPGQLAP